MPIEVEVNLKIPRVTIRPANAPVQVIDNSAVRFIKLIHVPAVPKPGSVLQLTANVSQTFDCEVTRTDWNEERELFVVSCSFSKRSISAEEYDALTNDAEWRTRPLL